MALQDILQAIISDADKRIAEMKDSHQKHLHKLHADSETRLERKRQQIAEQRDQKMRQLKEKTQSHARMSRSKALLKKRQEYMDALYAAVFDSVSSLPKEKTTALLTSFLKHIQGKGVVHPSKAQESIIKPLLPNGCTLGKPIDAAGGFLFVSDTEEQDFTYEFLIHKLLRESTEVQAAELLFSA